ncbi:MAG TPA: CehA/McbA family metallohydrolase [Bradyrhizobium sp.]|nr:CehA/McbA family metallohydrolase [Bradyrhizobium sp.]
MNAFSTPGRFFRGNLHTHSNRSDGARDPESVCAAYRDAGYDFLALTDHFLAKYGFPVVDTRDFRTNSFTTIPGAEVHAPATGLGELWHILSVGLPLDFAPTSEIETGAQLAQRCADAGAFVAIAHPAWYGLTTVDANAITCAHAVEIYNHTSAVRTDHGDGWYLLDQLLAAGRRLTGCATDDAHFHCDDAMGGWVMVKAERNEPELLVEALKSGNFYSSQGPFIHDMRLDRDGIEITCSKAAAVMLLGRGSRAEQALAPAQERVRLPTGKFRGDYMRAVVIDEQRRHAWSNPIWLPA